MTRREPLIRRMTSFLRLPAVIRSGLGGGGSRKVSCSPLHAPPPSERDVLAELSKISPILDGNLYLSGAPPINEESLKNLGITSVLCALTTYEEQLLSFKYPTDIRVTYVRAGDLETVHLHLWFEMAANLIHDEIAKGGICLVHCAAGVSRSPSLIMAYLIKYKNMSLNDAFKLIREKRKIVRPNRGFIQQLIEFEKKCVGKQSAALTINIPCTNRKFSL